MLTMIRMKRLKLARMGIKMSKLIKMVVHPHKLQHKVQMDVRKILMELKMEMLIIILKSELQKSCSNILLDYRLC